MFISNEGEWSFNHTSTASTVDVCSFLHHHLSTTTFALTSPLPTMPIDLAMSPSPLLRDMGSTNDASEARIPLQRPSPFQRDVGWLILTRQGELGRSAKEWGVDKKEGGPRNWEAHPVHHETHHDGKS